jgi:hypothetical protein
MDIERCLDAAKSEDILAGDSNTGKRTFVDYGCIETTWHSNGLPVAICGKRVDAMESHYMTHL